MASILAPNAPAVHTAVARSWHLRSAAPPSPAGAEVQALYSFQNGRTPAQIAGLKAGDLIVTAGTDGIFPPGLVVGRAASIKRKLTGMFLTGEIVPAVDLTKVEEVLVLRPGVPPGVAP